MKIGKIFVRLLLLNFQLILIEVLLVSNVVVNILVTLVVIRFQVIRKQRLFLTVMLCKLLIKILTLRLFSIIIMVVRFWDIRLHILVLVSQLLFSLQVVDWSCRLF